MSGALTIDDLTRQALTAYEALASLAEDIEDEWTYVTDLAAAWRQRIEDVSVGRGSEAANPTVVAAVERTVDEVGRISDAHRAVDWLSTFPQVVLTALGEQP